jgi:hypothetical protein
MTHRPSCLLAGMSLVEMATGLFPIPASRIKEGIVPMHPPPHVQANPDATPVRSMLAPLPPCPDLQPQLPLVGPRLPPLSLTPMRACSHPSAWPSLSYSPTLCKAIPLRFQWIKASRSPSTTLWLLGKKATGGDRRRLAESSSHLDPGPSSLKKDPSERKHLNDLVNHPWIVEMRSKQRVNLSEWVRSTMSPTDLQARDVEKSAHQAVA